MEDQIISFTRTGGGNDWRGTKVDGSGRTIRICATGIVEYLTMPDGILEFEVVFTEQKPLTVDAFELIEEIPGDERPNRRYGIRTNDRVSWYDNARETMAEMHRVGYRYVSVRFDG